jgi:CubicO group peptidase (beta-lactamase class C family)
MYSVSKSFVAIAIGFLEQEGKLSGEIPMYSVRHWIC